MSDRRFVAVSVLLAVVLPACVWSQPSTSTPASAAPTVQLSNAAIESLMIVNIKSHPDATSAIPPDATGAPTIMVRAGVLTVATTDPTSAESLCRTVAGMTNSPDTGAALGITEVIIIVPVRQQVASCRP